MSTRTLIGLSLLLLPACKGADATFGPGQGTVFESEADADTIEDFLDARAEDSASFDWSPLDETDTYKWVCPEWSKSIPYTGRATINARFVPVFEP